MEVGFRKTRRLVLTQIADAEFTLRIIKPIFRWLSGLWAEKRFDARWPMDSG